MTKKQAIISLLLSLPICAGAQVPNCEIISQENVQTLPLEEIKSMVQTFVFEQSNVPGLMIGIISNKEQAVISCGETAKGNQQRPALDTVWPIGSVSKVFTTRMLGMLVDKGMVRLDTTVDELNTLVQKMHVKENEFAVPAVFFCKVRWIGFSSTEQSGAPLQKLLTYCREQIKKEGQLTDKTIQIIRQQVAAEWQKQVEKQT